MAMSLRLTLILVASISPVASALQVGSNLSQPMSERDSGMYRLAFDMQASMGGRRGRGYEPIDVPMPEESEPEEVEAEPKKEEDDTYKIWFDSEKARDGADGEVAARSEMLEAEGLEEGLKEQSTSETPGKDDVDPEAISEAADDSQTTQDPAETSANDTEASEDIVVVDTQFGPNALPQVVEKPVEKHQNLAQLLSHDMEQALAKNAAEVTTTESPAAKAKKAVMALEKLTVQPQAIHKATHEIHNLSRWVLLSFGIVLALVATGTIQILGSRRRKGQAEAPDIMETEGY